MYIQAVHSRSKRLTTEERNVGQSGKINHRIEQEETEKIKRSKLGDCRIYIYIYYRGSRDFSSFHPTSVYTTLEDGRNSMKNL